MKIKTREEVMREGGREETDDGGKNEKQGEETEDGGDKER